MSANKITCLIVDDEFLARCLVREYLKKHSDIEVIGECDNGESATEFILTQQPDLIFLDMQMPLLTGLEVIAKTGRQQGVIFSTAYDEYAVAAFDKNAVDYLLKPYSQERFDKALHKFCQQHTLGSQGHEPLTNLLQDKQLYLERLQIKDRGNTYTVATQDITHIQAEDDYIHIFYDGKSLLKTQTLSDIEKQLNPDNFVRIHRSTLINLRHFDHLEKSAKDTFSAVLKTGVHLNISRSNLERLKAKLS